MHQGNFIRFSKFDSNIICFLHSWIIFFILLSLFPFCCFNCRCSTSLPFSSSFISFFFLLLSLLVYLSFAISFFFASFSFTLYFAVLSCFCSILFTHSIYAFFVPTIFSFNFFLVSTFFLYLFVSTLLLFIYFHCVFPTLQVFTKKRKSLNNQLLMIKLRTNYSVKLEDSVKFSAYIFLNTLQTIVLAFTDSSNVNWNLRFFYFCQSAGKMANSLLPCNES